MKLIPVFTEREGRKLFEGDFAIQPAEGGPPVIGHLEVEFLPAAGGQRRTAVQFVANTISEPANPLSGLLG